MKRPYFAKCYRLGKKQVLLASHSRNGGVQTMSKAKLLFDLLRRTDGGQDLYIRPTSSLRQTKRKRRKKR
jgi:hypothetical protein